MNCVLLAFKQHLDYLNLPFLSEVDDIYHIVRLQSKHNPNQPTFAGVVPAMAIMIASLYDLEAIVEQHPDFDFEKQGNEWERKFWPKRLNTKSVSLGPGVYCGYFSVHALFSEGMPVGDLWAMKVEFRKFG